MLLQFWEKTPIFWARFTALQPALKTIAFLPMIEFAQTYTSDTNQVINMSTETVAAIKTKLDNIINNAPARAKVRLARGETAVRIFKFRNKTDVTTGAMCAWYLQRYTNGDGIQYVGFSTYSTTSYKQLQIHQSQMGNWV